MHTHATENAEIQFNTLLNSPKSRIYLDTCFGKSDNEHQAAGIMFLLAQKKAILQSGKKIIVIQSVVTELKRVLHLGKSWARDVLNTFSENPDLFDARKKSAIEIELDSTDCKDFADEALRRHSIADASRGERPVILTGDYTFAMAAGSNVRSSIVFILDCTTAENTTVRTMSEFMDRFKNLYAMSALAQLFQQADMVLTRNTLSSKNFILLLKVLKRAAIPGQKLPIYIHKSALSVAAWASAAFREVAPSLHLVNDNTYNDEFSWIQATFQTRATGRDVIIVGNYHELSRFKIRLDTSRNCHLSHKTDNIRYFQIGPLGTVKGIKALNQPGQAACTSIDASWFTSTSEGNNSAADVVKAAYKGNIGAMSVLATMYEQGYGVRQSSTMALLWREKRDAIENQKNRREKIAATLKPSLICRFRHFMEDLDCYIKRTLLQFVLIK